MLIILEKFKNEYDKKYNEELNKTGLFWAFNKEQFDENKTHKDAPDNEYLSVGAGGYIHKSNGSKFDNFFKNIVPKIKNDFLGKIKMEDLIEYELVNHEAYYTGDCTEVSFTIKDYYDDLSMEDICKKVDEVYYSTKDKHLSMCNDLSNEDKVALKSGYYFMIFEKEDIPFFDELKKTDRLVSKDNQEYHLYEAPNWEIAKKVDDLMGNENIGYDIDEYSVDNNINI